MAEKLTANNKESLPQGRLSFQGQVVGPVAKLSGFESGRGHKIPVVADESAQAFVQLAGDAEVTRQADRVFQRLRREFALKRRDVVLQQSKGAVRMSLPGNCLDVWIELSSVTPSDYQIKTEVTGAKLLEERFIPRWITVLEGVCSELRWEPAAKILVEEVIDRLEEDENLRPYLEYPLDGSYVLLNCPDPLMAFEVRRDQVIFRIPPGGDLGSLFEGSKKLLPLLGGEGGFGKPY